jgi:hypothetical protein
MFICLLEAITYVIAGWTRNPLETSRRSKVKIGMTGGLDQIAQLEIFLKLSLKKKGKKDWIEN